MKFLKKFLRKNWVFLFLILIALPFRFYHFTYPILDSFNFRQAQTATIALNFYKNGINLLQTELDIFGIGKERFLTLEFPLYEAIVAILYKIFFVSDMWGRLVSIIVGFIGAWYLYKLVILLLKNNKIAFFSAFFYLFSPLNMFYQRTFMIEPTIIVLLLAAGYYFCHFVNYQDKKSYFLAIILLSLGFMHKGLYGPFWLLPMFIYYLRKQSFKKIMTIRSILLLLLPLLILFLWQEHVNKINTFAGHSFFTTTNPGHLEWNFGSLEERFSISGWQFRLQQVLNGIFLKPGLLLFLIGFLTVTKIDNSGFLLFWVISQAIYFVVLFRIQQQNYYQIIMTPVFSVFMSIGLLSLIDKINVIVKKFLSKAAKLLLFWPASAFSSFILKLNLTNRRRTHRAPSFESINKWPDYITTRQNCQHFGLAPFHKM